MEDRDLDEVIHDIRFQVEYHPTYKSLAWAVQRASECNHEGGYEGLSREDVWYQLRFMYRRFGSATPDYIGDPEPEAYEKARAMFSFSLGGSTELWDVRCIHSRNDSVEVFREGRVMDIHLEEDLFQEVVRLLLKTLPACVALTKVGTEYVASAVVEKETAER